MGFDDRQPKWKTFVKLWSKFPVLVFLSLICSMYEERRLRWSFDIEYVRLVPIFTIVLMFVTFIGNRTVIKLARSSFFGIGLASVILGIAMTVRRIVNQFREKGPYTYWWEYPWENPRLQNWGDLADECLFELAGLIFNVIIVLIISGISSWLKDEDEEIDEYRHRFWSSRICLNFYKWVVACLVLSAGLSMTATLATFVTKAFYWVLYTYTLTIFGHKVAYLRLLWIVTFFGTALIELLTFRFYKKKLLQD